MEGRPVFVNEDIPLESRESLFELDEVLGRSARLARDFVSRIGPSDPINPVLVIAYGGELLATTWTVMSSEFQEEFLQRVVPATLESYDRSIVALLAASRMSRGEGGDPSDDHEVLLLAGVDGTHEDALQEETYAAAVYRTGEAPPDVGMFLPVEAGIPRAVATALTEGWEFEARDA